MVPPEGTRNETRQWTPGFYRIAHDAHDAGVPIVMAYEDCPRQLSDPGPVFKPTGDIEADMVRIAACCTAWWPAATAWW